MDLGNIKLPQELNEMLDVIYSKAKIHNPDLTKSLFIQRIIDTWVESYNREATQEVVPKGKVALRNNLKKALKLCGKTQTKISQETNINRTYLGQVKIGRASCRVRV